MTTNKLKFGTETPSKLYMGESEVTKAYMGETLVYEKSESSGETWLLNETYTEGGSGSYNINFTSNGETFGQFSYGDMPRWFIRYGETNAYFNGTWSNQAYRTITFANPPTGDLLTWLQANGVKQ